MNSNSNSNIAYIEINNKINDDISFDFLNENEKFGLLTLKVAESPLTNVETLFLFTIDITGSMNEKAVEKNTKLDIVKQTFKSMIQYLSKLTAPIFIRLHVFNTEVIVLMETISINNKDKLTELYTKIDELFADNATDIENALKTATTYMDSYSNENPTHQICHIFMTDGYATIGDVTNDGLSKLVSVNYPSIFIGFGKSHNIELMKKLTDKPNSIYQFINNMEDTSLIYGETIHHYLYPAIRDVDIRILNGFIYDWKMNEWTTQIHENIISSNSTKIYHIKRNKNTEVCANIYDIKHSSKTNRKEFDTCAVEIPILHNIFTNEYNILDLTKYMLRHKTQILLFEAKSLDTNYYNNNITETKEIRRKINCLFKEIYGYMKKNDLLEDSFMRNLCDDLCITYKNIGTDIGNMFILSRYTSQGRQQTYSMTPDKDETGYDIQDDDIQSKLSKPNKLVRSTCRYEEYTSDDVIRELKEEKEEENKNKQEKEEENKNKQEEEEEEVKKNKKNDLDDEEIQNYIISNSQTSCYANECTLNTMQQMSQI